MSDYTPTTEAIRRQWNNAVGSHMQESRNAEFNRWLNAERARIWAEGFDAGHYTGDEPRDCECKINPYGAGA